MDHETSLLTSKPYYRSRRMTSPPRVMETRTGYKSRGLNGPPYFNTSFRHFFTVDSLLAYNITRVSSCTGRSSMRKVTIGISSSDTGSLEDRRR
jgi:hypothetical protein